MRFQRLTEALGPPEKVFEASLSALKEVPGISAKLAADIHARNWSRSPEKELDRLDKMGAGVITLADDAYPALLKDIFAPPPVLFVKGDLAPAHEGGIAVVGSRAMSPYGQKQAEAVSRGLAMAGISVVSGLARGVDATAHEAALDAGGHTVGVLGCGLDVPYPRENLSLAARMAGSGAVITEFPLGTPPLAANFPVRNRIIAGLSRAVVVVEGGIKSGSLITARHALDQGREIWAVPGPLGTPGVEGSHHLINQGARLLTSVEDILSPGALPPEPSAAAPQKQGPKVDGLTPRARRLLDLVGLEAVHLDEIVRVSSLDVQEVSAGLFELEMSGCIRRLQGNHFVLE